MMTDKPTSTLPVTVYLSIGQALLAGYPFQRGKGRLASLFRSSAIAHKPTRIVKTRDGIAFHSDARSELSPNLYFGIDYEPNITSIFRSIVGHGDVCVDIGACFGWYTLLFSALSGPSGTVVCFEPNSVAQADLLANLKLNPKNRVSTQFVALGDRDGLVEMTLPGGATNIGLAFTREWVRTPHAPAPITVKRLDDLHTGRVDVIKIDVEGSELQVLRGARNCLATFKPWVVAEMAKQTTSRFGYEPNALLDELRPLGYSFLAIEEAKGGLLPVTTFPPGHNGANVLCVPSTRPLPASVARRIDQKTPIETLWQS